jgi:hypothetical protein
MSWLARKFDTLIGAVFAALGGMSATQLPAFIHQYLQRLGGHLDEARRGVANLRLADLQSAYDALRGADALHQPFVFFNHLDIEIARRVLSDFHPALPFDTVSLIYGASGLFFGLAVYEIVKLPVRLIFGRRGPKLYGMVG